MSCLRMVRIVSSCCLAAALAASDAQAAQPTDAPPPVKLQPAPIPDPVGPNQVPEDVLGSPLLTPTFSPVMAFPEPEPPSHFPNSFYADHPTPGPPDAPSVGQPHYDQRDWRYGTWYRPRSATLTSEVRCKCPMPWRPRGYGNLFATPCTPYRMDYDPYVLRDGRNQFGPAYYGRQPNPFCSSHHHWTR